MMFELFIFFMKILFIIIVAEGVVFGIALIAILHRAYSREKEVCDESDRLSEEDQEH